MTSSYVTLTFRAFARYLKYCRIPRAEGNRVIIAGNGPSLKRAIDQHAETMKETPLFCVNFFADSPDYQAIKPLYYGLMDPALSLHKSFPRLQEKRDGLFQKIREVTDWDMHLFFPLYPGQMLLEEQFNKTNLHLHLCNIFPPFKMPVLRNPIYRTGLLMPPPQNILISAIYLCLNMGYKEIYLLGAEHSWTHDMLVKNDNVLYITNRHFSGTPDETPWKRGATGRTWKMHEILKALHKTFRSYHLLREYADYLNAGVYNLTPDSYIDAFERKPINALENKRSPV